LECHGPDPDPEKVLEVQTRAARNLNLSIVRLLVSKKPASFNREAEGRLRTHLGRRGIVEGAEALVCPLSSTTFLIAVKLLIL
jgi:hypothetical protein